MTTELPDTHPSPDAPVPLALKSNEWLGLVSERADLAERAMRRRAERYENRQRPRFAIDWIGAAEQDTRFVNAPNPHSAAVIAAGVDYAAISLPKWSSNPTYAGEYIINCYEIEDGSGRRLIVTKEA